MPEDSPAEVPRIRLRIATLSDLVFGLALSIGSITLIQHIPQDPSTLVNDVALFAFSFIIIVSIWLAYTRIVSVLPVETSGSLVLNLALLFCVALEPFLYYVLNTSNVGFLDFSSAAFALDTGSMMALLSGMTYIVAHQDPRGKVHRLSPGLVRNFKVGMVTEAFVAAVFLISVSDVFWVPVPTFGFLRFLTWSIAFVAFFAGRAVRRLGRGKHDEAAESPRNNSERVETN